MGKIYDSLSRVVHVVANSELSGQFVEIRFQKKGDIGLCWFMLFVTNELRSRYLKEVEIYNNQCFGAA